MLSDLRFAFRQLVKAPGFTATIVVTLALGIAACTVVFSIVNTIILHPLDNPEPDRLVRLRATQLPHSPELAVSPAEFLDWQSRAKSFEAMYAADSSTFIVTSDGEPLRAGLMRVTAGYARASGIKPLLGRDFLPEEDTPGKEKVVILSRRLWQTVFGGAASAIGRTIQLIGPPRPGGTRFDAPESYTVVGVAPDPTDGSTTAGWVPMAFSDALAARRNYDKLIVTARLRAGVTLDQAQAEMNVIAADLAREYPATNKGRGVAVIPVTEFLTRRSGPRLWTLLGAVGCVLLICCANVANLLLSRATARQREMSVRAAVGASRSRLIRQLLTESMILALFAGGAGVLGSWWAIDAIRAWPGTGLIRLPFVHLDGEVLGMALGLTLATALLFGLAPAWLASRIDLNEALKQGTRGAMENSGRGWLRRALVVFELALALLLLAGTGLFIRSLIAAARVDPGFVPEHAGFYQYNVRGERYYTTDGRAAFGEELLTRMRALPGVQAAGITTALPIGGSSFPDVGFQTDPTSTLESGQWPKARIYGVTSDYFRAAGIRLVRGRTFAATDNSKAPPVIVINETMAKRYFPNEDPIGKHVVVLMGGTGKGDVSCEVVGVTGDVRQNGPDAEIRDQIYRSFGQFSTALQFVVLRAAGDPVTLFPSIKTQVAALDQTMPLVTMSPLKEVLDNTVAARRFTIRLLGIFAFLALVIAAVGIYAVISFFVGQRTAEIGIRMALGATTGDVLRLVLGQGMKLVIAGLVVGLAATIAAGRLVQSQLFQTSPYDPFTLTFVPLLLAALALLACWLPSRRATKVDPIVALRAE